MKDDSLQMNNTEIAFADLSNRQLKKEILLFQLMNSPKLSQWGQKIITLSLALRLPVEWLLKATVFGHFCGGVSIEDCRKKIDKLALKNVTTILDYSKEHGNESTYEAATQELLKTIEEAKVNSKVSFAVLKFSSIADIEVLEMVSHKKATKSQLLKFEKIRERVNRLCRVAHDNNVRILIDAEYSWVQTAIDEVTEEMMTLYNKEKCIVFHTIQLYRHDRLSYLKNLCKKMQQAGVKTGVKLVRGAYMEIERERALTHGYPSPVHKTKKDTDKDYNEAIRYVMQHLNNTSLCLGTHNAKSVVLTVNLMREMSVANNDMKLNFAQLLGMANHITFNLSKAGYNTAKYMPYGKVREVMPYLFRRAEENKAITGEASQELMLRKKELKRRRSKKEDIVLS